MVDDEVIVGMELQSILEDNGAEVVDLFHTLQEALEHAVDGEISAAVLDIRVGRDSIAPVAKILSERGIPFLFYSGQPNEDQVCSAWPQTPLVSKPASARRLVDSVAALLKPGEASQAE